MMLRTQLVSRLRGWMPAVITVIKVSSGRRTIVTSARSSRADRLYTEARSWQDRALALDDVQDVTTQRLLAAQAASDEAASLAMTLAGETELFESLKARVVAAFSRDDLDQAEALLREALDVTQAAGN